MSTGPPPGGPVEERLAAWLSQMTGVGPARAAAVCALRHLGQADQAGYDAVAGWSSPSLDIPLRELSRFANFSKPWLLVAVCLAATGPAGRRAALTGVAAIGVTSLLVNQPMKLVGDRRRPDRQRSHVPRRRWVRMPTSTSFPSGHSASAAAFAVAVGDSLPVLGPPLRAAAATVAFSRVYTGVHFPGDVLVGGAVGVIVGRLTSRTVSHLTASVAWFQPTQTHRRRDTQPR